MSTLTKAPAPAAPATDSPTPPAPGAPLTDNAALPDPLDALHSALTLSPLQGAPHADLDALIAETAQPAPFTVTLSADPAAIGGLLILGAGIGALAVLAFRRVTSPEARRKRARSADERKRFRFERERYERGIDATLRAGARARGTATAAAPMVVVDEHPNGSERP